MIDWFVSLWLIIQSKMETELDDTFTVEPFMIIDGKN